MKQLEDFGQKVLFGLLSLSNGHGLASRWIGTPRILPKIFLPRYAIGAGVSMEEATAIFAGIPSLESEDWTRYWRDLGIKFEKENNLRSACMSYIMGCFPEERREWKTEITQQKRKAFEKWNEAEKLGFKVLNLQSPLGGYRVLYHPPANPLPLTPSLILINGLEGAAEEIGFIVRSFLKEQIHFYILSVPGSTDYERPMAIDSERYVHHLLDEMQKRPDFNPKQVGVIGFSFGALWTLLSVKTDPRIRFAICNGAPLHQTLSILKSMGINPVVAHSLKQVLKKNNALQLIEPIRHLQARVMELCDNPSAPILAMNGDNDSIVDPADTEYLGKLPNNRLLWIKGGDHCGLLHYKRMVSVVVGWSKKQFETV